MVPAVIFGAGGLGGVVRDILVQGGRYRALAFLDSDPDRRGWIIDTLPVLGGLDALDDVRNRGVRHAIVAIGANQTRIEIATALQAAGLELISAIHPLASISPSAELGGHAIVGPRVTVCVHAQIAEHCVLSVGSIVDHDGVLETGVFFHPAVRLAGGVHIGARATLGIGASVIPGRRVGRGATIDPGAVVIRDVPDEAGASGVPAIIRPAAAAARFVHDRGSPIALLPRRGAKTS